MLLGLALAASRALISLLSLSTDIRRLMVPVETATTASAFASIAAIAPTAGSSVVASAATAEATPLGLGSTLITAMLIEVLRREVVAEILSLIHI